MDEFFSPTNGFSLLERYQLYIIAKYKASNCCKIEAVIQRCSVKKAILKNLAKLTGKPLCRSLFFNNVAAEKETLAQVFSCEFAKFLRTPFL